jgi:hypothetical protein
MPRVRLILICIALVFLIGAGIVWILSSEGVVAGYWVNIIATGFVILGLIVAFLQWTVPLPPLEAKQEQHLPAEQQAYAALLRRVDAELKNNSGVIFLRTDRYMNHTLISVRPESDLKQIDIYEYVLGEAPIKVYSELHTVNGHAIYAAIIKNLAPGNYVVGRPDTLGFGSDSQDTYSTVTVNAGHVTEIDWHRNGIYPPLG